MYTRYKKEKRITRKLFWDKVVGVSRSALSGSWVFVFTLVVVAFGLSATFNAASVCVLAFLIPRTTCRVDATSTLQLASEIVWQVANYCVIDKLERCVIEAMHKQINKLNKSKTQKKKSICCRNSNECSQELCAGAKNRKNMKKQISIYCEFFFKQTTVDSFFFDSYS